MGDKSALPSVIFGSTSSMGSQLGVSTNIRIGMWPALSKEAPETAMGLMSVLAILLERLPGVTVYRVFSRLEGDPASYVWNISKSQFDVEAWQIDSLDDNAGIWGNLKAVDGGWEFTLEFESDFSDSDDTTIFSHQGDSISDLVNWLPEAAAAIGKQLEINVNLYPIAGVYDTTTDRDGDDVSELLSWLFKWELGLLLALWGSSWNIRTAYSELLDEEAEEWDDLADWIVASAVARTLLFGYYDLNVQLPPVNEIMNQLDHSPLSGIVLARALFENSSGAQSVDVLEHVIGEYPENTDAWLTLADLYRRSGDQAKSVDAFQRAIETEIISVPLLVSYAQLLPLMEGAGWSMEEFVYIDPDEITENRMSREAIEAYEQAVKRASDTDNPAPYLVAQLQLLIDVSESGGDFERLWRTFKSLV
ncbi:MAG TPA: tetratricopeptide repeat protein, partial [Phototrophicaceae bacterium]|nr:tetratricopeptide repeat protein [Phototrophicaceae bacterium]